jgi:5-methylcytosine-specific restriction protein A
MQAILLTWKPSKWAVENLKKMIEEHQNGQTTHRWSSGTTKQISVGSRVFLMKQGKGQTGIFGSGEVVREPYEDDHYNADERKAGKQGLFVDVNFDQLYDPTASIPVDRSELREIDERLWNSQGSGKKIQQPVAAELERLWSARTGSSIQYAEEVLHPEKFVEGASKAVTVNAYERSPEARAKCIAVWGTSCAVCNFHFEFFYGPLGKGYIHVHHLKPLSEMNDTYVVNPIDDLRPVCPNCHAMLHKSSPPLSIEELRNTVSMYGRLVGR